MESDLWWLVIGAILATFLWRFLGTFVSRNMKAEGAVFEWITCVSYAMLAGLISRMIFIPVGSLQDTELWIRLVGVVSGLLVFFFLGRNVLLSVGIGLALFIFLISHA